MKKLSKLLLTAALCLLSQVVPAQEQDADDIIKGEASLIPYENLNLSGYTSTGFSTSGTNLRARSGKTDKLGSNTYCGDIVVPSNITTLYKYDGWTNAGAGTFQYSYITSCKLPASITTIQQAAFSDCPYLQNITVDSTNTKYMDIDGVVYQHNGDRIPKTLISVPGGKKSINIPETVTRIENCALDGCIFVKEVTIPESVSQIGIYAFTGCNIEKLTVLSTTPPQVEGSESGGWWGGGKDHGLYGLTVGKVYVPESSVSAYKGHDDWNQLEPKIEGFTTVIEETTFKLNADVTAKKNVNDEVYQISRIEIQGADGETLTDTPEGWTLTGPNGNTFNMSYSLENSNKTLVITFPNNTDENSPIDDEGKYLLSIPAGSLKTADGKKECEETVFYIYIIEKKVVQQEQLHGTTLLMNDSDKSASLKYTKDNGTVGSLTGTHTIGAALYISDKIDESHDNTTNTTTITIHKYYSANAEYKRTFRNNKWQAYYAPFTTKYSVSMSGSLQFARIDKVNEFYDADKNITWFYLTATVVEDGETIEANHPYIMRSIQNEGDQIERTISLGSNDKIEFVENRSVEFTANNGSGNCYTFIGHYSKEPIPSDAFAMSGGSLKQPSSAAVELGAYRWYLSITPAAGQSTTLFSFGNFDKDQGTTDIGNVKGENENTKVEIYDLAGRRIETITTPGIYIVNGRKLYVNKPYME